MIEKAEIITDIIRKLRDEFGADNFPVICRRDIYIFDEKRCRDVSEYKMSVTVFKVQMRSANFRINHQNRFSLSAHDQPARRFNSKGRGGAGDIHIKSKARCA